MIEVDISGLTEVESGLRVSDLQLPEGVTSVADPDELVVKLAARRVVEEEEPVAEAEAPEEGVAEAAEGAEPPEASEPAEAE